MILVYLVYRDANVAKKKIFLYTVFRILSLSISSTIFLIAIYFDSIVDESWSMSSCAFLLTIYWWFYFYTGNVFIILIRIKYVHNKEFDKKGKSVKNSRKYVVNYFRTCKMVIV